jgi:hypothetical protein
MESVTYFSGLPEDEASEMIARQLTAMIIIELTEIFGTFFEGELL